MNINQIHKAADVFYKKCQELTKEGFIKKLPNGQYRVLSEKGKNLGTYKSMPEAKKRLQQVEFFKHKKASSPIDLTKAEEFTLSSLMRQLNANASKEQVYEFLKIYKNIFDNSVENSVESPEKVALQNALVEFGKNNKVVISEDIIKNAAITELGNPQDVGKYLSNIIKFTLTRISPKNRQKAINRLKYKIYYLNESEIANKKMPASSSMGQSITFVKHVLFNHNSKYIREVLNNIVRNL